jgi:Flp pilus assembly protein TadD
MNAGSKALLYSAICLVFCAVPGGVSAQTVGTSRRKIPQDPAIVELNNTLAEAQAALDRKDYAVAATGFASYLEKKPDDAAVHFELGYALTGLQKIDEAKVQYEKAIELNPKMPEAYLNLGLSLLDSDPAAAVAPLQKATELLPTQERPRFALGVAFERIHKIPNAIEQYQAAEKLDDKDVENHLALGRTLLAAKRLSEAETEFRTLLNLQKDSTIARLGLAESLLAQNKTDAAADAFRDYLAIVPDDHDARVRRASLLFNSGKIDESLAELDLAAKDHPEAIQALKLRALIDMQKKNFPAAVETLKKAVVLAPQDPALPAELGHAYLESKDYPSAIQELFVAGKANPSSLDILGDLVTAEYLSKNYQAALSGLDTLARYKELPAGSWFIRATCYDKLGLAPQALAAYQKFLELNKDENSDAYFEAAARSRTLAREIKNKR